MSIIQMAGVGVVGTLLALQFKNGKNEYAIYTVIAVSLVLFYGMKDKLESIQETVSTISSMVNINTDYISILLKMIGITYVAEFGRGFGSRLCICRNFIENAWNYLCVGTCVCNL